MQTESLFVGGINDGKIIPVDDIFRTIELTVGSENLGIIRIDCYLRNGDNFILLYQENLH